MFKRLLLSLLLCAACGGSTAQQPSGSPQPADADAGAPPAADDGGAPSASPASDAGPPAVTPIPGAGAPANGSTVTLDCGAAGKATLAWTSPGYQNPGNAYDSRAYSVMGPDTLGGALIQDDILDGHFLETGQLTLHADGSTGLYEDVTIICGPIDGCSGVNSYLSGGLVYSPNGGFAAMDRSFFFSWDHQLPAGADASIPYSDPGPSATAGGITLFSANRHWTKPPGSLVAVLGPGGDTRWTRVFDDTVIFAAADESGATVVGLQRSAPVVIGPDGTALYPLETDANGFATGSIGGGRLYRQGDSVLRDVITLQPSVVLPFVPAGLAVAQTSRRLIVAPQDQPGTLVSVDLSNGAVVWQRQLTTARVDVLSADGELVVLDSAQVLHHIQPDGTDAFACQLPPYSYGTPAAGNRVIIGRYGNIEAYDLPR